jgi:signal peptide peptidase SppA
MEIWCVADSSYIQGYEPHLAAYGSPVKTPERSSKRGRTLFTEVVGPLSKWGGRFNNRDGRPEGTSYVTLARTFRKAAEDDSIGQVIVRFDSGGGASAGLSAAVSAFEYLTSKKNTIAVIDDLAASAAYWLACIARKVIATPGSISGSIGCFMVFTDVSELARRVGISIKLVKTGKYKGTGTPGTEITDEQIAPYEMMVREIGDDFLRTVVRHRKLSPKIAAHVAEAAVFHANFARVLGLVDEIGELEDVFRSHGADDATLAFLAAQEKAAAEVKPPLRATERLNPARTYH